MASSFAPFRHRNFALMFTAGLVSIIGTWIQQIAVGSLVAVKTGRASWTVLAAVVTFLPSGLLSPVGGALADRVDRRRFLMIANLVDAGVACVLVWLAATDRAAPAVVLAVVAVEGCIAALRLPFYQAMLPQLVPTEDLLPAVALNSANYNLGRVIGPAIAAAVIAFGSYTLAFAINAASFLVPVVALVFVRLAPAPVMAERAGLWADIRVGLAEARKPGACRSALLLMAIIAFFVAPFIALIPAVAREMAGDAGGRAVGRLNGIFTTAQGVGAVIGALCLAPIAARLGRRRTLVSSITALPLVVVLFAFAPTALAAVAALALLGAVYVSVLSGLSTTIQLAAPAHLRGRMLSLFMVSLGTLYPIGSVVQGQLGDRVGIPATLASAAVALAAVLGYLALARPQILEALEADRAVEPVAA